MRDEIQNLLLDILQQFHTMQTEFRKRELEISARLGRVEHELARLGAVVSGTKDRLADTQAALGRLVERVGRIERRLGPDAQGRSGSGTSAPMSPVLSRGAREPVCHIVRRRLQRQRPPLTAKAKNDSNSEAPMQ